MSPMYTVLSIITAPMSFVFSKLVSTFRQSMCRYLRFVEIQQQKSFKNEFQKIMGGGGGGK